MTLKKYAAVHCLHCVHSLTALLIRLFEWVDGSLCIVYRPSCCSEAGRPGGPGKPWSPTGPLSPCGPCSPGGPEGPAYQVKAKLKETIIRI